MTEDETRLYSSCVLLDPLSLLARPEMPVENNQGNVCHRSNWWVYSYSALSSSGLDRSFGKVVVKYSIIAIIVSLLFLRLYNLYFLFLFLWSLTLSSKYWVTVVFKRVKDIIHGRWFFYSLMSQMFLTLLLYFTHLIRVLKCVTEGLKASSCCPFLGKGKEWGGKDGNVSGYVDQRRSHKWGRADLFCPEQKLSQGFGAVHVEDFFQLLFQEKEGKLPIAEGFLWAPVAGGIFSHWIFSYSCCPCPTHCKMLS